MNFAFVILHYDHKSIDYTLKCVNSINKLHKDHDDYIYILIIDNNSRDTSCDILNQMSNESISVLCVTTDIGFSLPINKSIDYFKQNNIKINFFISLNNDTKIISRDFISMIKKSYLQYNFDILGPQIKNLRGINQNPYDSIIDISGKNVTKYIHKYEKQKKEFLNAPTYKTPLYSKILKGPKSYFKKVIYQNDSILKLKFFLAARKKNLNFDVKSSTKVPLHGSALIFSSNYVKKFGFLFYPKPGFFAEEDILHLMVIRHNLVSIYNPLMKIIHFEDISTNIKYTHDSRELWKLNQTIESLKFLKNIYFKL